MYERRFRESTLPGMKTRRECKMTKMVYRKTCDQILYALLSQISFDLLIFKKSSSVQYVDQLHEP